MELNDIKQINQISNELVEVVYGDSVTGDTYIETNDGPVPIKELFEYGHSFKEDRCKEFCKTDYLVKSPDNKYNKVSYIVRHKTKKVLYKIITNSDKEVEVTEDHSLMVCPLKSYDSQYHITNQLIEISPKDSHIGDYIFTLDGIDNIKKIICKGIYTDYVYDICVDTNDETQHVFFANGILVHNTDSLYLSYEGLLNTIEGADEWSLEQKTEFIVKLNKEFLDSHNEKYIRDYYDSRFGDSVHEFELETLCASGVWLDVKKRYAQLLLWKDGKTFDVNNLPLKAKGMEIVKSSYPKQARESLTRLTRFFLEDEESRFLIHRLNMEMRKEKELWMQAELEDICGSVGVQNYTKYIIDDNNKNGLIVAPKCPYNVRALGNHNRIRNIYNLPGDPIYGGKMKWYIYKPAGATNKTPNEYFAFQSRNLPDWALKYATPDRNAMFQQFVLDPFNRILNAVGLGSLNSDGFVQMGLFD